MFSWQNWNSTSTSKFVSRATMNWYSNQLPLQSHIDLLTEGRQMNRTDALHRRLWLRRVKLLESMVSPLHWITTVGGLAHFTDLGIRQLEDHALAGSDGLQSVAAEPGDSRIVWLDLPTSLASPVVSDGESGWFAVAEALTDEGPFRSGLYRTCLPRSAFENIHVFGAPTALVMAGDDSRWELVRRFL
jgi:hypothetical protein